MLEERFGLETRESFPTALWNAARDGKTELEDKLRGQTLLVPLAPLHVTPPGLNELDLLLKEVLDYLVIHQIELPHVFWELTSLFFVHIIILPTTIGTKFHGSGLDYQGSQPGQTLSFLAIVVIQRLGANEPAFG